MRSFEHGYLLETPISHSFVAAMRAVGELRGRQGLYTEQFPVRRLPQRFTIAELKRACPGVSYPTLQRALADLRKEKVVRCLGRGPDARWERIEG